MGTVIGIVAIGLMVIVTIIAAASLLVVGTMPLARYLENRRSRRAD